MDFIPQRQFDFFYAHILFTWPNEPRIVAALLNIT